MMVQVERKVGTVLSSQEFQFLSVDMSRQLMTPRWDRPALNEANMEAFSLTVVTQIIEVI